MPKENEPLSCPKCGKTPFKNASGLSAHMRFVHGKKQRRAPSASPKGVSELEMYRRTLAALEFISPNTKKVFDLTFQIIQKGL